MRPSSDSAPVEAVAALAPFGPAPPRPPKRAPRSKFGLMLRMRGRLTINHVRSVLTEAPVRVAMTALFVVVIWFGLYGLFLHVFRLLRQTPLEGVVAIPLVFNFFFLAMLALLVFSNAILAFGSLFSREEVPYLLSLPLPPVDAVLIKYLETLVFSSWSLILLGLPLMMAMADATAEPRMFYPLFLAFFLAFIPIPGALGLGLAWAIARFFPRKIKHRFLKAAGAAACFAVAYLLMTFQRLPMDSEKWLREFLTQVHFVESALWPNTWVAKGIDHAMGNRLDESLGYLFVTLANGAFLSWIAVHLVARHLAAAYDTATSARHGVRVSAADQPASLLEAVFFYLSPALRRIAVKDLRTFLRDPLQWSQLLILFGLMTFYLMNIPYRHGDLTSGAWTLIIPFLNLCAVSLILATFTSRFVYPMISLEGRQLWLIGLLPIRRGRILVAKFAFALTVTLLVAGATLSLEMILLKLDWRWALIHLAVTLAVCFGLCSLAVGIGARWPMFHQLNTARIANGMGGTINLVASVLLSGVLLTVTGYATWRAQREDPLGLPTWETVGFAAIVLIIALSVGSAVLSVGARHFERVEV